MSARQTVVEKHNKAMSVCSDRVPRVACLQTIAELAQSAERMGVRVHFGARARRQSRAKRASGRRRVRRFELLADKYWAEEIVDARPHLNRQLLFCVKWEHFSHEHNTWQRLCDVIDCDRLLDSFHARQFADDGEGRAQRNAYSVHDFHDFRRLLGTCCGPEADVAIVLRLRGKCVRDRPPGLLYTRWLEREKRELEPLRELLANFVVRDRRYETAAKIVLRYAVRELRVDQRFGSLHALFAFAAQRERTRAALREWETSVNAAIGGDGCPLTLANDVDADVPPVIQYLHAYDMRVTVARSESRLERICCTCDDNCTRNRSCECALKIWRGNRFKTANVLYECNALCACRADHCPNRRVQDGSQARLEVFRTEERGWGVRTADRIKYRDFVMHYVGEVMDASQTGRRDDDRYFYAIDGEFTTTGRQLFVDSRVRGNVARFANHSCEPNLDMHMAVVDPNDAIPRIAFFANRDIAPYEELTYDYGRRTMALNDDGNYDVVDEDSGRGSDCDAEAVEPIACLCGAQKCRKFI